MSTAPTVTPQDVASLCDRRTELMLAKSALRDLRAIYEHSAMTNAADAAERYTYWATADREWFEADMAWHRDAIRMLHAAASHGAFEKGRA